MTLTSQSVAPTNRVNGNNPEWTLTRTIAARSMFSIFFTGTVNANAPVGDLCYSVPVPSFENRSCMWTGNVGYDRGTNNGYCDAATGLLLE